MSTNVYMHHPLFRPMVFLGLLMGSGVLCSLCATMPPAGLAPLAVVPHPIPASSTPVAPARARWTVSAQTKASTPDGEDRRSTTVDTGFSSESVFSLLPTFQGSAPTDQFSAGTETGDRAALMAIDSAHCAEEEQHEVEVNSSGQTVGARSQSTYYPLCMRSRGW